MTFSRKHEKFSPRFITKSFFFSRSPAHKIFFSSTRSSLPQSPTPICMFYFSHPFGISTPSSANNVGSTKPQKKGSKYTTTTYLVTEIQKNISEESQDDGEVKKQSYTDRELIPWPKNFLLPPLIQLLEKKHGKWLVFIFIIALNRRSVTRAKQKHKKWKNRKQRKKNVKFPEATRNKVENETREKCFHVFPFKCLPIRKAVDYESSILEHIVCRCAIDWIFLVIYFGPQLIVCRMSLSKWNIAKHRNVVTHAKASDWGNCQWNARPVSLWR